MARARVAALAATFVLTHVAFAMWTSVAHAEPPAKPLAPFPEPEIRDDEPPPGPLDRRLLTSAKVYDLGTLFFHGVHHEHWSNGVFDLTTGQELRTDKFPFYLVSTRAASIRMYDEKSYGLSFIQDIGGGVALGPFEPEVHVGAHIVELDVFHANWDFSLLSPRASVELGVRVKSVRVEAVAYAEYLVRWYGESYLVRGLSLGIQLDQPKMRVP